MSTYDEVVRAAQRAVNDDTKDTWVMADAILAHVPGGSGEQGRRTDLSPREEGEVSSVPDRLKYLAHMLTVEGVTTPSGGNYTAKSLTNFRDTAMIWSPDERFADAAYRTHQEAGSPTSDGGRVLAALVKVAHGDESVVRPKGIDPEAWIKAIDRVANRRKGFKVVANDVRVALKRKTNNPGDRDKPDADDADVLADASAEDLVDNIDPATLEAAYQESRKRQVQAQFDAELDGMTDTEKIAAEDQMNLLRQAAGFTGSLAQGMSESATSTPLQKQFSAVDRETGFLVVMVRKHGGKATDEERQVIQAELAICRENAIRNFDLAEMQLSTGSVSDAVEAFLSQQGG